MNTSDCLISIVLPTYNGSKYIELSIRSILGQTHSNFELIVVDGGSTDNTLEIVQSFKDSRIKIIHQPANSGRLPGALNLGFAHAAGDFFTWAQDDDYYTSEALERMLVFLLQNPDVGLVYTGMWLIDGEGKILREANIFPPEELSWTNPVGHCFLYRREVAEKVGLYDVNYLMVEDVQYWMRVYKQFKMAVIHERHYYHRLHSNSLTVKNYGGYLALRRMAEASRNVLGTSWIKYQQRLADAYVEEAFAAAKKNDFRHLQYCLLNGIIRKPAWLFERGIYSIWIRGLLGLPQKEVYQSSRDEQRMG